MIRIKSHFSFGFLFAALWIDKIFGKISCVSKLEKVFFSIIQRNSTAHSINFVNFQHIDIICTGNPGKNLTIHRLKAKLILLFSVLKFYELLNSVVIYLFHYLLRHFTNSLENLRLFKFLVILSNVWLVASWTKYIWLPKCWNYVGIVKNFSLIKFRNSSQLFFCSKCSPVHLECSLDNANNNFFVQSPKKLSKFFKKFFQLKSFSAPVEISFNTSFV